MVVVVGTPLDFRLSFGRSATPRSSTSSTPRRSGPATSTPRCRPPATSARSSRHWPTGRADGPTTSRGSPAPAGRSSRAAAADELAGLEADSDADQADPHLRRAAPACSTATRSSSATAATSCRTRASTSTPTSPAAGSTPGPYGCLGTGMGYAMAARIARPDKQVVVMLGDGAAGFSLMDVDTLVRHDLPVVIVVGNNGIWGLEKHPMQALYGYDVAADLQPGLSLRRRGAGARRRRRDRRRPRTTIGPALDRALRRRRAVPGQRPHRPRGHVPPTSRTSA